MEETITRTRKTATSNGSRASSAAKKTVKKSTVAAKSQTSACYENSGLTENQVNFEHL